MTKQEDFNELYLAAASGDTTKVGNMLAEDKYDRLINKKHPLGNKTPLWAAIDNNWDSIVKIILSKSQSINVDSETYFQTTPLMYYSYKCNIEMVKSFLEKGANAKATNDVGYTSLHQATAGSDGKACAAVMKLLLNYNANINAVDDEQENTALHLTIVKKDILLTTLLLDENADTTISNSEGKIPLCELSNQFNSNVLQILLGKIDNYPTLYSQFCEHTEL